eukprot:3692586-Rhodomonas_salina.2
MEAAKGVRRYRINVAIPVLLRVYGATAKYKYASTDCSVWRYQVIMMAYKDQMPARPVRKELQMVP